MARTKKPGNPWNMFSKKKQPPTAIKKREPGASVKAQPNRNLKGKPDAKALPPGKGGRGGALTRTDKGTPTSGRVSRVRVSVVDDKPKLQGSDQRRLPGGTGGADSVRGSGTRTGQPGRNRPALPPAKTSAAASTTRAAGRGVASGLGRIAGPVATLAAIAETARSVFNPKDNILTDLQKLPGAIRRDSYRPNPPGASRTKADTIGDGKKGGGLDKNRPAQRQTRPVSNIPPAEGTGRGGPSDVNRGRSELPRPAAGSSTGSSGKGSSSSGGATRSSSPAIPSAAMKAAPAGPSQSKNMDENYAAWAKANKDLAAKVKEGQAGYGAIQKALGKSTSGTGPVKDGNEYASKIETKGIGPVKSGDDYASTLTPTKEEDRKKRGGLSLSDLRNKRTNR